MTEPVDTSRLKILELGDSYYFKSEYPERTTLLWTGAKNLPGAAIDAMATPARVARELKAAQQGKYDVVIAYPLRYPAYHPRYGPRILARYPLEPWSALTRSYGVSMLRWIDPKVPVVAVEMGDAFSLGRPAFFLLDKAKAFFKRELPVDRWQILCGTLHQHVPTLRYRRSEKWQRRLDKLRPISLPQWNINPSLTHAPFPDKTSDIFFAGSVVGNSSVRSDGMKEIARLKQLGLKVDIPEQPLPFAAYQKRMAASWLAWSPEGLGWDCNRHYEAPLVQTIPVSNYPTILRHAPLQDGEHAFYYPPEPGGLERAVISALSNKSRLKGMALAARDHVLAHHTRKAYCDHILRAAILG